MSRLFMVAMVIIETGRDGNVLAHLVGSKTKTRLDGTVKLKLQLVVVGWMGRDGTGPWV